MNHHQCQYPLRGEVKLGCWGHYQSVSPVAQLCPTLCNPTDCSTPGFPVLHQLRKFVQTHVLQVGDAI